MAKTFTETKSLPFEQVKIKNLTENRDGVIEQFNGNLSSENIYSINIDRLEDPKNITSTAGNVTKRIVSQPTQTYALVSRDYRNTNTDSSDIWEPIDSLNPETDVFQKGFNTLQGLFGSARYQDFPLTFDCEEGMPFTNTPHSVHHPIPRDCAKLNAGSVLAVALYCCVPCSQSTVTIPVSIPSSQSKVKGKS